MKYIFLLLMSLIYSNLSAQSGFNWINHPTIDGVSTFKESRIREYKLIEGNVKEIKMVSFFIGDDEKEEVHVNFSKSGNVTSILKKNIDPESDGGISSVVSIDFLYNEASKVVAENVLTIIEGDTVEQLEKRWPEWFPFLPEPIATNTAGSVTKICLYGDTTFSFYDQFNRKIMDSIPTFGSNEGQKITFKYQENKIERVFFYLYDPEYAYKKEEYTVDERGNWIELKYYGVIDIDNNYVSQIYTREITYY